MKTISIFKLFSSAAGATLVGSATLLAVQTGYFQPQDKSKDKSTLRALLSGSGLSNNDIVADVVGVDLGGLSLGNLSSLIDLWPIIGGNKNIGGGGGIVPDASGNTSTKPSGDKEGGNLVDGGGGASVDDGADNGGIDTNTDQKDLNPPPPGPPTGTGKPDAQNESKDTNDPAEGGGAGEGGPEEAVPDSGVVGPEDDGVDLSDLLEGVGDDNSDFLELLEKINEAVDELDNQLSS